MIVKKPFINIYDQEKITTQFIFGEQVDLLETSGGKNLLKSKWDNYQGWTNIDGLTENINQTHKVKVISTPVFKNPDLKSAHICNLSLNSMLSVISETGDFSNIDIGWVYNNHICHIDEYFPFENLPKLAKGFLNVPYVWGGKTAYGIDCSALIQMIFMAVGISIPRDTSEQVKLDWQKIDFNNTTSADLIFWDGHIGMMIDKTNIIHANTSDMMVKIDTLENVIKNIQVKENKQISKILRYNNGK